MNKIIVTGSAGFIGYHLVKSLHSQGFRVLGIDNINSYYDVSLKKSRLDRLIKLKNFDFKQANISDKNNLKKIFNEFKPNKVVNLAAQAGVRYSIENPEAYVDSNLVGFVNMIELSKDFEVEGFIYASSSSVYGGNKKMPFSVDDRVDKPLALYGATKRANELIAHSYSNIFGLNTTGLRFFTVYGPWGRPDMAMLIFTKKIINDQPIPVFNNGDMKRDFTYIDDIIRGTVSAVEKNYKFEIFNLGNNKSEKLMDMIKLIEENLNKKAILNFQPIQAGDVIESFADIEYSKEKLNYLPTTDINEGIPKMIDWYLKYYE